MSIGDYITIGCLLIAVVAVPRMLIKVYAPGLYAWVVNRYFVRDYVGYAYDDSSDDDDDGSNTSSSIVVPAQQHQMAPAPVLNFEGVLDFLKRHNLTDEQAIDLLTVARRESGDLLSANKIRDIVGGNEAQVKARVAQHRPRHKPAPARRLERPAGGW